MESLAGQPLRDRQDVRDAVDAKLGHGEGMSPAEAWEHLDNVERVEWILGELWFGLSGARFHLWIQGQAERDLDAPRYVAAIGQVAAELDPEVSALLRWTGERARAVRAKERGEALFSIVPLVWDPMLAQAGTVFQAIVERWPEGLDLAALEAGTPPQRGVVQPTSGLCRYPGCAVGFTDHGAETCIARAESAGAAMEAALLGLWKHGVSDDELEAFAAEASEAGDELGGVLARWVDFDGRGTPPGAGTLSAFRRALDPIAAILGIDSSQSPALHRVQTERLGELADALEPYGCVRVQPDEEANFLIRLRSALRMDPPVVLVDSADIENEEHTTLVVHAIWTGMIIVMGGDAPGAQSVLDMIAKANPA